jgi:NAD(P)H-hydrate epimerase|tara:strand:- start:1822 stop:3366 length:1545 start_codon:yes stop_codon:yes gene_type:complete
MTDLSHINPKLHLFTADQVRRLESIAIDEFEISALTLMERAGAAAFSVLNRHWPDLKRLVVVCGPGNNGGDGYVVARLAAESGIEVTLVGYSEPKSDEAREVRDQAEKAGLELQPATTEALCRGEVIVDGLLGSGLTRPPEGPVREVISLINKCGTPVLSLDIPSGLESDTGATPGRVVKADVTVTFIGFKPGLFTGRGREFCGELHLSALEVPQQAYDRVTPTARCLSDDQIAASLPHRPQDVHKGQVGRLLVVGGDIGMSGAVTMAGEAAYRVGAGLVTLATRREHAAQIGIHRPELMTRGVEDRTALGVLIDEVDAVVAGPGLGNGEWAAEMLEQLLECDLPLVIDADGLNQLVKLGGHNSAHLQRQNWILTPHPGEAGRLLDCVSGEVQNDRFASMEAILRRFGGVCVLKGSGTLVGQQEQLPLLCQRGNSGMASGGMGDVLSGVIGGLLVQGMTPLNAASAGVWLHALAADSSAEEEGEIGMVALDLMAGIRRHRNRLVGLESDLGKTE